MIGRFFNWMFGPGQQEIHVHVHLTVEGKSNAEVVRSTQVSHAVQSKPVMKKTVPSGPTSSEIASINLAGGIEKAKDNSGNNVIKSTEGANVNVQVESLKHIKR
jgi:hypothetical protein